METQNTELNANTPKSTNPFTHSSFSRKAGAISVLVLTALIYQNFDFADGWKINLIPLNEKHRATHAKELLGKYYDGSAAQMVENANSLGMAIFNDVYRNLPKKYKTSAVDVSTAIIEHAEKYEIDPVFVVAVIKTESSLNPMAKGRFGEIGLMQLKPDTAAWIAKKYGIRWKGAKSLENPKTNVILGIAYLNFLRDRFDGHANKYLSAYNMGAKNVCRMYASDRTPHEYSMRVMKNYNSTYRRLAAATTLSLLAYGD